MICENEFCELKSTSQREAVFVLARVIGMLYLSVTLLSAGDGRKIMGNVQHSIVIFSSSKAEGL